MQEILFLWCSFVIIQSQTHLHALDVKYYFPILMYQKCIPISYYTFHVPSWNSASRHRFLSQLNQFRLPVFCNEGVYRIVADITHQKKNEFSGIIPLLGGFHMTAAVQHSIGKLNKHAGLDDELVEMGFWNHDNWNCDQWESLWLLSTRVIDPWRCSRDIKMESILEAQQRRRRKVERSVNIDCIVIGVKKQRQDKSYLCSWKWSHRNVKRSSWDICLQSS